MRLTRDLETWKGLLGVCLSEYLRLTIGHFSSYMRTLVAIGYCGNETQIDLSKRLIPTPDNHVSPVDDLP